jgi:hypothetical protein
MFMRKNNTLIVAAGCILLLAGCQASPLYVGQWGKNQLAVAPAAVPRDGRGEPVMDNLPPLGPVVEPGNARALADPPLP